jgi:Pam16
MYASHSSQQYTRYFEANDPSTGGSFYLQSKVFRARESLQELLTLQQKQAAETLKQQQELAAAKTKADSCTPPKSGD